MRCSPALRNSGLRWWLVGAVAGTCLISGILILRNGTVTKSPPSVTDKLLEEPEPKDHGYIGWNACAECHPKRVSEFRETRHFQALRLPNDFDYPKGFRAGEPPFVPTGSQVRFEARTNPRPEVVTTVFSVSPATETTSPIAFIYGAGAGTDEVYFTRRGNQLFEMPLVWLSGHDGWGTSMFDPHGTGDLSRPLSPQCLECHTVWVDYKRGTTNEYGPFDSQLLGVTCERCHGPAKDHVAHHRAHPDDKIASKIVQPKMLSRDLLMDLCAQCHTNSVRHRRAPFSYRPGEPLNDSFRPMPMQYSEEDRVANQVRYLKESRCYQKSDSMTCTTCHNPHHKSERDDPLAVSRSCVSCHKASECGAQSRLPESLQGQCATCHMPRRNKVQVHFTTGDGDVDFPAPRFEHRIAVYPEVEHELMLQFLQRQQDETSQERRESLQQALTGHWQKHGDSMKAEHRFLVAIDDYRTALRFAPPAQAAGIRESLAEVSQNEKRSNRLWFEGEFFKKERRLDEAVSTFEELIKIKPKLARAQLELGTLYAATARSAEAIRQWELASQLDPNDPSALVMLGWLAFLDRQFPQSLEHYQKAHEIDPWNAKVDFQIAQCLGQLGRWEESITFLEHVLEIDPRHQEAGQTLRRILRERFSPRDALPHALRATEFSDSSQSGLLLTLAEIQRDLNQQDDAKRTLQKAKSALDEHSQQLKPQIDLLDKSIIRSRSTK